MLNALPQTSVKVFGDGTLKGKRNNFRLQRKLIAAKLGNPRLLHIRFHTFRHWKATMLYHQTKDILGVREFLGHRRIDNTMLYIQLEKALFQEAFDEFIVKITDKTQEIKKILEVGFEYVCSKDGLMFFRRRK